MMSDNIIDDLRYNRRRPILLILIVAVGLILLWVLWPLIFDVITGNLDDTEPPSDRLSGQNLTLIFPLLLSANW